MKKEKMGNILQLQRGYDLPMSARKQGNVPVVGSNGILGFHNIPKGKSPTVTVGRSGSVGKVHLYHQPVWVHNTALYIKDFKGNDPIYLYYLLKSIDLESLCGSSVVPSLDRNVVHALQINFHENKAEQRLIAQYLEKIDKKNTD